MDLSSKLDEMARGTEETTVETPRTPDGLYKLDEFEGTEHQIDETMSPDSTNYYFVGIRFTDEGNVVDYIFDFTNADRNKAAMEEATFNAATPDERASMTLTTRNRFAEIFVMARIAETQRGTIPVILSSLNGKIDHDIIRGKVKILSKDEINKNRFIMLPENKANVE